MSLYSCVQAVLVWHPRAHQLCKLPSDRAVANNFVDEERDKAESQQPITIDECLRLFTSEEVLSERNMWYCPSCKEHRRATKQMHLWKLPRILIVQLKRFRQDEHSSFRRKNSAYVDCPLQACSAMVFDLM